MNCWWSSLLLFGWFTFISTEYLPYTSKRSSYFLLFHQCPNPYYKRVHSAKLASPILWLIFRHSFPKCSLEYRGRSRSCLKGRGTAIAFIPVWQRIDQWRKTLPFGGSGAEWHLTAKCLILWKSKHWDTNHHIRSQSVNFPELSFPCFCYLSTRLQLQRACNSGHKNASAFKDV